MDATQPKRTPTDWIEARDFWLALPPPRSSQLVADRYRVTRARVNYVRKRDNWDAIAAKLDAAALAKVTRRIVRSRIERNDDFLDLYDTILIRAREQVAQPDSEVPLAVVPAYGKHAELIEGEATERMGLMGESEVTEALGVIVQAAVSFIPKDAREAFLAEVRRLLGGGSGGELEAA